MSISRELTWEVSAVVAKAVFSGTNGCRVKAPAPQECVVTLACTHAKPSPQTSFCYKSLKQDASRNKGHCGSDRRESIPQVPMSTFCLRPSSLPPSILSSTDATSTNSSGAKPCFQRRCARNRYQFSSCTSAANTCTDCIECNLGHVHALRPKLLKCASSWTRRNAMQCSWRISKGMQGPSHAP